MTLSPNAALRLLWGHDAAFQTDLFAGYQHKLFGQYGMYTGDLYTAFNPYEFENVKTRLFLLNHLQE